MTSDTEWVAALIAPWVVSPHPNFRPTALSGAARLALVVEQREYDLSEHLGNDADERLIRAAAESTHPATLVAAREALWGIAKDTGLDWGPRVAAASFAAIAASETEEADLALPLLTQLLEALHQDQAQSDASWLVQPVLLSQIVLRNFDSGNFDAALAAARDLESLLEESHSDDVSINLSRGVSWDAKQVVSDISEVLKMHASEAIAYLEQYRGDRWRSVVRSRSGWIDMKLGRVAARRDNDWVVREFDRVYEANSGIVRFGGNPRPTDGYDALLLAELSGSLQKVRNAREMTARLRGTAFANGLNVDSYGLRDAVRYLRQARVKNPLQHIVRRLRDVGPTDVLVEDARSIVARVHRTGYVSDFDLVVLEDALDFFPSDELASVIPVIRVYLESAQLNPLPRLSRLERVWSTVGGMAFAPAVANLLAEQLFADVGSFDEVPQPLANTALRVLRRIDWSAVDDAVIREWRTVIDERSGTGETFWTEAGASNPQLSSSGQPAVFSGIRAVAARLDAEVEPSESEMQQDWSLLQDALSQEIDEGQRGVTSFGSMEVLDVAIAFLLRRRVVDDWDLIVRFLASSDVSFDLKRRGIRRLARSVDDLPEGVRRAIVKIWPRLGDATIASRMLGESEAVMNRPEYLEAGIAMGAFASAEVRDRIVTLSIGAPAEQLAVARSLAFFDWSSVSGVDIVASQLLASNDPVVKSEVAYSVGRALSLERPVPNRLEEQLRYNLRAEGNRVKLRIVEGFASGFQRARTGQLEAGWEKEFVVLRTEDRSAKVRSFASQLLELVKQS